jgi:hypothetical protein
MPGIGVIVDLVRSLLTTCLDKPILSFDCLVVFYSTVEDY